MHDALLLAHAVGGEAGVVGEVLDAHDAADRQVAPGALLVQAVPGIAVGGARLYLYGVQRSAKVFFLGCVTHLLRTEASHAT